MGKILLLSAGEGVAKECCDSEGEKSIALDWKARLVLPGQGTQDKENKAVCTKAEFPLKARISGGLSAR